MIGRYYREFSINEFYELVLSQELIPNCPPQAKVDVKKKL